MVGRILMWGSLRKELLTSDSPVSNTVYDSPLKPPSMVLYALPHLLTLYLHFPHVEILCEEPTQQHRILIVSCRF